MTKNDRISQLTLQLNEAKEKNRDIELAQAIITVGIRSLSLRMLTTLVLIADCVLFAWALANGSWQSLLTAVLFAVVSWAVLYLRPPNLKEKANEEGVVS